MLLFKKVFKIKKKQKLCIIHSLGLVCFFAMIQYLKTWKYFRYSNIYFLFYVNLYIFSHL
jgi:hypothetical protein